MRHTPPACSMAETIAETQRLILRTWDEADIAPFMAGLNTPAVMYGSAVSATRRSTSGCANG